MIADDSDAIRLVLHDILEVDNHEIVAEAKDGAEAVSMYDQATPDVLLLDLAMPKKDGLTVVKEIVSKHKDAKIILITASEDQKIIQQSIDNGAKSFISKPFDFTSVLKSISSLV